MFEEIVLAALRICSSTVPMRCPLTSPLPGSKTAAALPLTSTKTEAEAPLAEDAKLVQHALLPRRGHRQPRGVRPTEAPWCPTGFRNNCDSSLFCLTKLNYHPESTRCLRSDAPPDIRPDAGDNGLLCAVHLSDQPMPLPNATRRLMQPLQPAHRRPPMSHETHRSLENQGCSRPTRSIWPGDSIWKQPSVSERRIISNVASSSRGTWGLSRSSWRPVARWISVEAANRSRPVLIGPATTSGSSIIASPARTLRAMDRHGSGSGSSIRCIRPAVRSCGHGDPESCIVRLRLCEDGPAVTGWWTGFTAPPQPHARVRSVSGKAFVWKWCGVRSCPVQESRASSASSLGVLGGCVDMFQNSRTVSRASGGISVEAGVCDVVVSEVACCVRWSCCLLCRSTGLRCRSAVTSPAAFALSGGSLSGA